MESAAPDQNVPCVILVGLPGAGKSTAGNAVAAALGRQFIDLDAEIARAAGSSITEIFAAQGEHAFRAMELAATERLRGRTGLIISPGGGWMTNPGAAALLRPPGRIIHLAVPPEIALARLAQAQADRPLLLGPHPLANMQKLLADRKEAYSTADYVIDTQRLSAQQVTAKVMEIATNLHL
jgi:shikimate kinase